MVMDADKSLTPSGYKFISVQPISKGKRSQNSRLSRAHAASIARKAYLQSQRARENQRFNIRSKPFSSPSPGRVANESDTDSIHTPVETIIEKAYRSEHVESRALAPIHGAIRINTFEWNAEPISVRLLEYLSKYAWPIMAGYKAARAWFEEFCKTPLVFHVSHLAAAANIDLLAGQISWVERREILSHKIQTIQTVQQQVVGIESLSAVDTERLIFAVITLACNELGPTHLFSESQLLLSPHFPATNFIGIYGRFKIDKAHAEAIKILVKHRGRLHQIELPGLALSVARIDLREASFGYKTPMFPSLWELNMCDLRLYETVNWESEGTGFADLSYCLPEEAVSTFRNLALLDQKMNQLRIRSLDNVVTDGLMSTRNALHHQLLSLSTFEQLGAVQRKHTHRAIYEILRLTCVLYSNAVMLGLPPHNGWHVEYCGRLRWLLSLSTMESRKENTRNLMVWAAIVGGMASYHTSHFDFFKGMIADMIADYDKFSWKAVRNQIQKFVWSDEACSQGAELVFEALGYSIHSSETTELRAG